MDRAAWQQWSTGPQRVRHKRLSPHAVGCSAHGTLSVNVIHVHVHTHTQLLPYLSSKQNTLSSDLCHHFHILCHILCVSMTLCVCFQCRLPCPCVYQRHGKARRVQGMNNFK